ncbi:MULTISPECIES: GTPase HflX [Streptococcus]|uniref:GTPase HflX n=2 Tax=Streptococcus TaxID=1301 RepID=A0A447Z414_9STRE|nr:MULTISPECIES: GTPase HflX [Streptococcus]MCF4964739.1 GTPase HflX [Streptococcus sp. GS001]RSK01543.1 GTPase HflX [Streptococcus sp. A12]VED67034.1 GTP-binding protein HflX [Streptococcus viridans]VEE19985.1 GTP-binding protein HflX [Streptococcus australis]
MIETEKKQERVLIVGVELQGMENFDMSMEELASLAKTAGAEVVGVYTQKREKYDSKTFVGSGKLEEIAQMVDADEVSTVVVNNRLTPRQNVNLEEILGVKVIDRMQLILDIFAMRARSHEGKLQVHLAQLKYLLPRLVGQGIMLSRQAGGIGSRGPGESQLELNRRSVRNQITDIERQLKVVEKNREVVREKRLESPIFKIGLIGYTNAGKSTIMNALTSKTQYEADELFATLDATTKSIHLTGNLQVTLTDTVGFIQDLPTELVTSFKSTLEESKNVDLLVHVIDASDPNHEEHEKTVLQIMKDLEMLEIPRLTLYNKADKVADFTPTQTPYRLVSAKDPDSRTKLQDILLEKMQELFHPFTIQVPFDQAYRIHELETIAILAERSYEETGEVITGYIAPKNAWRLEEFYHHGLS